MGTISLNAIGLYKCPNCDSGVLYQITGQYWRCPDCFLNAWQVGDELTYDDDDIETPSRKDGMPECCVACGCGAYPKCKTSCKIFDEDS